MAKTSLENEYRYCLLKNKLSWTSYKVNAFNTLGECLGNAELKRTKITARVDDKNYSGKIPGLLGGKVELVDQLSGAVIYRCKPKFLKFPMIILDDRGNEIFRVNKHFWEGYYTAVCGGQEIAVMKKKGFFSLTRELSINELASIDPRDLIALFMVILLKERRDIMMIAAAS